jgi:polyribonucleotide nucleotidyltransferase
LGHLLSFYPARKALFIFPNLIRKSSQVEDVVNVGDEILVKVMEVVSREG